MQDSLCVDKRKKQDSLCVDKFTKTQAYPEYGICVLLGLSTSPTSPEAAFSPLYIKLTFFNSLRKALLKSRIP